MPRLRANGWDFLAPLPRDPEIDRDYLALPQDGWVELDYCARRSARKPKEERSRYIARGVQDEWANPETGEIEQFRKLWSYPGNTHTEAEVFAKVKSVAYDARLPETWDEVVPKEVNKIERATAPLLQVDFWDGLTSVEGYGAIRLMNATFYKTRHVGTWETALQYQYKSKKWGMGREFVVYAASGAAFPWTGLQIASKLGSQRTATCLSISGEPGPVYTELTQGIPVVGALGSVSH